jgi:two-component system chemotaxis sensor kinase CheA
MVRGLERWRLQPSNAALVVVSRALHRLPRRIAALWVAEWVTCYCVIFATSPVSASPAAIALFLMTMTVGPIVVSHSLMIWLGAPLAARISVRARELGVALADRNQTVRGRLMVYMLCLGTAPATYMAAVAITARDQLVDPASLLSSIGVFLIAVAGCAATCAVQIAAGLTEPIAAMVATMRAIIRRGTVARVDRVPRYSRDEIGAMSDVTNSMLERLGETEAERYRAAESLAALNQTLEARVADRTTALARRNADMRLVLDSVAEGMFVVDATGVIIGEYSAPLAAWFGPPRPGQICWDYLGREAPELGERLRLSWDQLADGFLPLDLALDQMPRQVRAAGRDLELSYRTIGAGLADGLLVLVEDVTARVEREAAERDKREAFAAFKHMAGDRAGFLGFLDEGGQQLTAVTAPETPPAGLKRALHTLKGNSLLFGVESVAAMCHVLETELEDTGELQAASREALRARWECLVGEIDGWVGHRRSVIELEPDQLAALRCAVGANAQPLVLLEMLRQLTLEPVRRRLEHFAEQARRIAARLDKQVDVEVVDDGVRVDPQLWGPIWSAFVHALRNAIGHGLEPAADRVAHGKHARGRIALRARCERGLAVIEIEDDGRGIAWDLVRTRAAALGLPAETHDDLLAALFADGLSTASQVSDVSGRGIGLGALRAELCARGGAIEIASTPGRGTCLRLTAPAALDIARAAA